MIKLEFNEHEIMNEIVDKFDVSSEAELEDIKTRKTLKNRLFKRTRHAQIQYSPAFKYQPPLNKCFYSR